MEGEGEGEGGSLYIHIGLMDNRSNSTASCKKHVYLISFNILDKQLQAIEPVTHFHFTHHCSCCMLWVLAEK